jgi:hypothetical protein
MAGPAGVDIARRWVEDMNYQLSVVSSQFGAFSWLAVVGLWRGCGGELVGCTGNDSTKIHLVATLCNRLDGRLGLKAKST